MIWILRFNAGEWYVCRAFRTPYAMYQFGDHIQRVWGAFNVEYSKRTGDTEVVL